MRDYGPIRRHLCVWRHHLIQLGGEWRELRHSFSRGWAAGYCLLRRTCRPPIHFTVCYAGERDIPRIEVGGANESKVGPKHSCGLKIRSGSLASPKASVAATMSACLRASRRRQRRNVGGAGGLAVTTGVRRALGGRSACANCIRECCRSPVMLLTVREQRNRHHGVNTLSSSPHDRGPAWEESNRRHWKEA